MDSNSELPGLYAPHTGLKIRYSDNDRYEIVINSMPSEVTTELLNLKSTNIKNKLMIGMIFGKITPEELIRLIKKIKRAPCIVKDAISDYECSINVIQQLVNVKSKFLLLRILKKLKEKNSYEKDIIKAAKFGYEKSNQMQKKFKRFKKLSKQGLILNSIWELGIRDKYAGDANFHGNTLPKIVEQCALRLTNRNALIVDPMAGSGTTIDVCKLIKRRCKAFDLSPIRKDIIKNNSVRKIPIRDFSADMVFLHPPYWSLVKYSKDPRDLSKMTLGNFYAAMAEVFKESYRILKPKKYLCLQIGDLVRNGEFIPLTRKLANIAEQVGFKDSGYAVKITHSAVSERAKGKVLYAELTKSNNLKINHDTVMFLRKS